MTTASPRWTMLPQSQRDTLEGRTGKAFTESLAPADFAAHIGRRERGDRDTRLAQRHGPGAIGAEPGPGRAAQRQQRRCRADPYFPLGRLEDEPVRPVEADEAVACLQGDAHPGQPGEPDARQRRGLEALGKDPPARSDEGRLAERNAPIAQMCRREACDRLHELRRRRAITREKDVLGFAMRQIEPAAPGKQEFARGRRHALVDHHRTATLGENLRCHQPSRAGADDGDRTAHAVRS